MATKKKFIDWRQSGILSERYFDIILSDIGNTFLLLIQAPIIGLALSIAWKEIEHPTQQLYFFMIISAVWFGCFNSCKEIVKEIQIYERERLFNLNIVSYVYSKLKILAVLSAIQCFLLILIVNYFIPLDGNMILIFITLFLGSVGGLLLGLIISALVNTPDKAIGLAILVTIPQIIFSKIIIPPEYLRGLGKVIEHLMIVKWSFDSLEEIVYTNPNYFTIVKSLSVLIFISLVYFFLVVVILKIKK